MPTEIFTKQQFEDALPSPYWKPLGLMDGEYCYSILVKPDVEILIRSSVKGNGVCAQTGADSIRCSLVDSVDRKPLASKDTKQRWVARTKNWRTNLHGLLRIMYKFGIMLGTCPKCRIGTVHLSRVRNKSSSHYGELYISCWGSPNGKGGSKCAGNYFRFLLQIPGMEQYGKES